jgi:hypothetical protein
MGSYSFFHDSSFALRSSVFNPRRTVDRSGARSVGHQFGKTLGPPPTARWLSRCAHLRGKPPPAIGRLQGHGVKERAKDLGASGQSVQMRLHNFGEDQQVVQARSPRAKLPYPFTAQASGIAASTVSRAASKISCRSLSVMSTWVADDGRDGQNAPTRPECLAKLLIVLTRPQFTERCGARSRTRTSMELLPRDFKSPGGYPKCLIGNAV